MARFGTAILATLILACPTWAAAPSDPDWPCIQRKVEHLSAAAMWPHPLDTMVPLLEDLEQLAARLALRRVSEEEAQALLDQAAANHPNLDLAAYGDLFQATFAHIDRQRAQILAGITRYAQNQARLSSELEALRAEMTALETASEPDFDRMDDVEAEIDWHVRIFNDRARALTYVCESPVLLEQRAFVIARMLLQEAG